MLRRHPRPRRPIWRSRFGSLPRPLWNRQQQWCRIVPRLAKARMLLPLPPRTARSPINTALQTNAQPKWPSATVPASNNKVPQIRLRPLLFRPYPRRNLRFQTPLGKMQRPQPAALRVRKIPHPHREPISKTHYRPMWSTPTTLPPRPTLVRSPSPHASLPARNHRPPHPNQLVRPTRCQGHKLHRSSRPR